MTGVGTRIVLKLALNEHIVYALKESALTVEHKGTEELDKVTLKELVSRFLYRGN